MEVRSFSRIRKKWGCGGAASLSGKRASPSKKESKPVQKKFKNGAYVGLFSANTANREAGLGVENNPTYAPFLNFF